MGHNRPPHSPQSLDRHGHFWDWKGPKNGFPILPPTTTFLCAKIGASADCIIEQERLRCGLPFGSEGTINTHEGNVYCAICGVLSVCIE